MGLVLDLIMLAASSGLLGAIFQMFSLFGGYLWVVVFRGAGLLLRGFAWIWFWAVCFEGRLSYLEQGSPNRLAGGFSHGEIKSRLHGG